MYDIGKPDTLYVTLLVVPSSDVVTTAVVLVPSTKFTVSYGFTKSFSVPLFCKFHPAFNTSDKVAALFPAKFGFGFPSFVGFNKSAASAAVIGAAVLFLFAIGFPFISYAFLSPSFTCGKLDLTFVILFPPLFNPLSVRDTALSGSGVPSALFGVIVIPFGATFTLSLPFLSLTVNAPSLPGVPSAFLPPAVTLSILISLLISVLIYVVAFLVPSSFWLSIVTIETVVLSPSTNLTSSLGFTLSWSLASVSNALVTSLASAFPTFHPDSWIAVATLFPVTTLLPSSAVTLLSLSPVPTGTSFFKSAFPSLSFS